VYITDTNNDRIRKVTVSTGIITTIAGTGIGSYSGDNGAATSAQFYWPRGVALDASGAYVYIFMSFSIF
jgi:DNA-binding beta-propeller fold protein YncE